MTSVAPHDPASAPARATARREDSEPSVPTTTVWYVFEVSLTARTLCDRVRRVTPSSLRWWDARRARYPDRSREPARVRLDVANSPLVTRRHHFQRNHRDGRPGA